MNKKIIVRQPWKMEWLRFIFRNCGELDCICVDDLGLDMDARKIEEYEFCKYHSETAGGWKMYHCAQVTTSHMKDIVEKNQVGDECLDGMPILFETDSLEMDWNGA